MKNHIPRYYRQREKHQQDRAFCRIKGKKIWLGIYGSPESKRKYADLMAEIADQKQSANADQSTTVIEVMSAYMEYAEGYYGLKSPEWYHLCNLMKELRKIYTLLPGGRAVYKFCLNRFLRTK